MKILVTGAVGFIGFHLVENLIKNGHQIIGIDNINSYYDVRMKYDKLPILGIDAESIWPNKLYDSNTHKHFKFGQIDITNRFQIEELFRNNNFEIIINLAAQAGVQYSIENPHSYIENNITGFVNLIDAAKKYKVKHFIYASSSSVYGDREDVPFKETDNVDFPISLYAASKKSNELIAHTYTHLYDLRTTGLRFFTVYGPWGRPDMAPFIFTKRILENKPIHVYNKGEMERDFTFVDDIIDGIVSIIQEKGNNSKYNLYNIGNSEPVKLMDFISSIENITGNKAVIEFKPLRSGDVLRTFSDISKIRKDYGFTPKTSINAGLREFIKWFKNYR